MNRDILVDTSYLYALYDQNDKYHTRAYTFAQNNDYTMHIPDPALVEAFYLARRRGIHAKLELAQAIQKSNPSFIGLTDEDRLNALQIMANYSDQNFDYADCVIMALSERLGITQIATFDKRDFTIFKPKHADYLEIVP